MKGPHMQRDWGCMWGRRITWKATLHAAPSQMLHRHIPRA
jgi:hypothetical protein